MAEVINSDKIQTYIGKYMLTLISFQSKEHFLLVVIPMILQTIWGVTCFSSPKELGSCGDIIKIMQDPKIGAFDSSPNLKLFSEKIKFRNKRKKFLYSFTNYSANSLIHCMYVIYSYVCECIGFVWQDFDSWAA